MTNMIVDLPVTKLRVSPYFYEHLVGYNNNGTYYDKRNLILYRYRNRINDYRIQLGECKDGKSTIKLNEDGSINKDYFNKDTGELITDKDVLPDCITLVDLYDKNEYKKENSSCYLKLYSELYSSGSKTGWTIKSKGWNKNLQIGDEDRYIDSFFVEDMSNKFVIFYGIFDEPQKFSGEFIFEENTGDMNVDLIELSLGNSCV